MTSLYCYDNETIKWTYGDNLYCLHIQHDNEADNNLVGGTTMIL